MQGSALAPTVLQHWTQRKNLLPGLALIALAAAGWIYVAYEPGAQGYFGARASVTVGCTTPATRPRRFCCSWA